MNFREHYAEADRRLRAFAHTFSDLVDADDSGHALDDLRTLFGRLEEAEYQIQDWWSVVSVADNKADWLTSIALKATRTEMKILEYLNHGRPVAFDRFFRDCWPDPVEEATAHRAIDRTNDKLLALGAGREIIDKNGHVQLISMPDK